ncbi:hypothetical protein B0H11DRAFT_5962 [Mycena galericulata]|nr:hypothetical protein B0H11DRAFT_5962 [Mycena galericulata]
MIYFAGTQGFQRILRPGSCALLSPRSKNLSPAVLFSTRYLDLHRTVHDSESRNRSLVDLVEKEHFAGAERIRLHLESDFVPIEPNPVYERAALAQIRWKGKQDLQGFLTWLHLVPDNQVPSRVEDGPFTKTRNILFRRGTPARNLLLIKEFSLVCAAKGYGRLVWDDLILLMARFEHPGGAVAFFLAFEAAILQYYSKYHPGLVEETASDQRNLLIILCCDAGWLEEAVQLVQDSSAYRINQACDRLMGLLRAHNDTAKLALVEECLSKRRNRDTSTQSHPLHPPKTSTAQRISNLFTGSNEPFKPAPASSPDHFYSTRSIIEGSRTLRPRTWIAAQLKDLKRMLTKRSLVYYRPPGNSLHSLMAHYDACKSYPHGLFALRKRALSASDSCSYTWLCKEMFYLHESRKFPDILALFGANFDSAFLPRQPWHTIGEVAAPSEPLRTLHAVPTKLEISFADAWIIWNALIRLSVYLPHPLPTLETLRHSVVHYSSKLTDSQFRAFPTSYTAVFRSIIWAYGEIGEVDKAVAAASDMTLIGKTHASNVGLLDELAGVHARSGNVPAATQLLNSLEELPPRVATYGVMMDAYLQAGLVQEAAELEIRMKGRCGYVPGANWKIDATLKALRAAEDALDPELT